MDHEISERKNVATFYTNEEKISIIYNGGTNTKRLQLEQLQALFCKIDKLSCSDLCNPTNFTTQLPKTVLLVGYYMGR